MNLASTVGYFFAKSATVALISSSEAKPLRTTLYPLAAREWAIPSPIPLSEPVTRATLLFFLSGGGVTWRRGSFRGRRGATWIYISDYDIIDLDLSIFAYHIALNLLSVKKRKA